MWPLAVHVSIQDGMGLKPLLSSSMSPINTFGLPCTHLTEHLPTHPMNIYGAEVLSFMHGSDAHASQSLQGVTHLIRCKHCTGKRLHSRLSLRP